MWHLFNVYQDHSSWRIKQTKKKPYMITMNGLNDFRGLNSSLWFCAWWAAKCCCIQTQGSNVSLICCRKIKAWEAVCLLRTWSLDSGICGFSIRCKNWVELVDWNTVAKRTSRGEQNPGWKMRNPCCKISSLGWSAVGDPFFLRLL